MVEKEEAGGGISEEEAAQYDRQIRLWGLEAQKRLRASRVLLVGMKGLGAEIAKNLILAGVKGLTMLDHEQVSPEDPGAQFLIRTGSVGRNRAEASLERAQNLNPMVDVKVDTENIEKKPESFFTQFDAKVVFCSIKEALEVDWSSDKAKAALKRTTPDYFLLQVLLKFRTDKGRDPNSDTFGEDSELLLQIRNDVLDSLGVNPDLLPEDFVSSAVDLGTREEELPLWMDRWECWARPGGEEMGIPKHSCCELNGYSLSGGHFGTVCQDSTILYFGICHKELFGHHCQDVWSQC
ncbi:SUMO-activating enzyme subunit 1 isoform X5 [Pseudorca crassidens]|uniref:SUMO-activating enzyme subunit 1 isoform X5 n=1 Tax=Pseudorca crassidens TaxID=82174 RepID=UPI00352F78FE